MTGNCSKSLFAKLSRIGVCAPLLACAISYPAHAQDAREATPIAQLMQRHVMLRSSVPPDPNRVRRQVRQRTAQTDLTPVNTGPGIVYTCDPSVAASTCNYLNTTVAGFYNSTFTNANGSVYIQYGTTSLGESLTIYNFVTYSKYVTALTAVPNKAAFQTDAIAALNTYDAGPYSGGNVKVTSALGRALGFSGMKGVNAQETATCTAGTSGCYDVVITVSNTAPLYYDDQGGTESADAYDYYAVVMHETDEMLGTSSCIDTNNNELTDGCANLGGSGVPSDVDLFRYTAPGTLALSSAPSQVIGPNGQYFSYNGGANYGAGGDANVGKIYNTLANGDDFADYSTTDVDLGCSYNEAIQDAEGCPGEDQGLTVLNDGESELTILATVGYELPGSSSTAPAVMSTPTPGSTLTSNTVKFTWTAGTGVSAYDLHLSAVSAGGYDLYTSGHITATSTTVSNLPVNGGTIYARLYSIIDGTTTFNDYTYKAETVAISQLTSPAPKSTLTGTSIKFTWSAVSGVSAYDLHLSAVSPGGYDLYVSGHVTTISATVNDIPINGKTIYARLYSIKGGVTYYNDFTYTAASLATLKYPAPSSTFTSTSVFFEWTAGGGVSAYDLHLSAVSPGGYDLYSSGHTTSTIKTVNGLPTNGETIYARLYSIIGGVTYYNDYTYKAK
ncbi:MAG: hypothetical protein ABSG96_14000 [Terracidiphilus sp.]